jgi:N-acetylneuraminate lyase
MDSMVTLNQNGIYAALFTPFNNRGEMDIEKLRTLVCFELDRGVEGFYCCGSAGEGLLQDAEERKKVIETVAAEVGDKVPFVVHTGALSTRIAIDLSLHARQCGAAAISLIPPIYYHYSAEEIAQYYMDVVNAVDLGVIIYNIPQFTGISFSKKDVFLKDPKIIGIKHTSVNLYDLERIREAFPDKIIFNGLDEIWLYSLSAGANAAIGTMINVCPKLFKQIREEFRKGEIPKAQGLQHILNGFIETITTVGIFPAAKHCMALQSIDVGSCRKPFIPLSEDNKKQVERALKKIKNWL